MSLLQRDFDNDGSPFERLTNPMFTMWRIVSLASRVQRHGHFCGTGRLEFRWLAECTAGKLRNLERHPRPLYPGFYGIGRPRISRVCLADSADST
jgi:hypothetical protein